MATGIRDKVVVLGMGCSKFGERWDCNAEDLMVEAFEEALADAGIDRHQIEAAWFGTAIEEQHVGKSGVPLAMTLRLPYIPVTRVENYCATGTEAFRGAVYAVASGAVDIALALGVEKLKDTGYGGLPQRTRGALRPSNPTPRLTYKLVRPWRYNPMTYWRPNCELVNNGPITGSLTCPPCVCPHKYKSSFCSIACGINSGE